MLPAIDPIARLRDLHHHIGDLGRLGLLTPDSLKSYLDDAKVAVDELAEQVRDDEHFEITLDGLQHLHRGGRPVRWRGHLQVIDGDRP